jgi:undecaprenyl diphosphate synthase
MVVGGTVTEWAELSDALWAERLADLGKVADHVGASWLTVRPFGADGRGDDTGAAGEPGATSFVAGAPVRRMHTGGCDVLASPITDGRGRLVAALAAIAAAGEAFTDDRIAQLLNDPAAADPDLVLVLGAADRLPASIVWELAYSELVYVNVAWADLQPQHLTDAITSFSHRHRRFGGLD